MDQRSLLYISLLFVGFLMWQTWQMDHAPQVEGTTEKVQTPATLKGEKASPQADVPTAVTANSSVQNVVTPGVESSMARGEQIHIKTDVLDVLINTKGGDIETVHLPAYPVSIEHKDVPFTLLDSEPPAYIAQSGLVHDKIGGVDLSSRAPNHYAIYTADRNQYQLEAGKNDLTVILHWKSADGVKVTKRYIFERGSYAIKVSHIVENGSEQPWVGRQYSQLRHGPTVDSDGSRLLYTYTGAAYHTDKYNKLPFEDMETEPLAITVDQNGWVAVVQHYFLSAWIPGTSAEPQKLYSRVVNGNGAKEFIIGMSSSSVTVPVSQTRTLEETFYAGPESQQVLEGLAEGLELTVDYGVFTIFSKPIFWLMTKIHAVVGNWGWSIILLTMLIKLALYPLSKASYRSMAKMKAVAPKMQSLKERYADDKQGLQQAMMELYKTEKINPLGGCLPILVQIPIFIALYWVLLGSVELRQAPWILWIQDLSIMDPYFVLPVLMGITMFVQQKLNPPPPDPMQAKLMMALPFVFTVFFAFFPAGLVLYWFVNNLLSITQQYVVNKEIEASLKH